jgi:endoglucanase
MAGRDRVATASALALAGALSWTTMGVAADAPGAAQAAGDWIGVVEEGGRPLRIAVHLRLDHGVLAGVLDSPDQAQFGLPIANVQSTATGLSFDLPIAKGRYEARWESGGILAGAWSQSGATLPLTLKRGGYPFPFSADWNLPAAPGLTYTPIKAARARVGPSLRVGKCVNMSGALDAPNEGDWGPPIADDDFAIIRAAGFSTVRLPVAFSRHAAEAAPYAIDPAFLARVRHVVERATAAGLNVILDMHNYDEVMRDPEGQRPRYAALWRQVATRFADSPPTVWFELLNEPYDKLDNHNLGALYAPALAAIRQTNPKRIVIVGPQWNNLDKMLAFAMPDDPHVVPSFHYYDPFLFTHQGAAWADPTPPIGRPFGSAEDKAELDRGLDKVRAYIARTGRVPFVGEYGVQDDPRVPLAQRIRYNGAVSSAFASVGVDSCAWGYRNGFRLRDGDRWLPGMVEAIKATEP